MANRNRRNSSSKRSRKSAGSFTGVLIMVGVVIGILLTSAGYMFFSKPSRDSKSQSSHFLVKKEKSFKKEKEKDNTQNAQRFEFYTLLPGMEVQLPDAPSHSHTKIKNQANIKQEPVNGLVHPVNGSPNSNIPSTSSSSSASASASSKESKAQTSSKQTDAHYILQAGIFQELRLADELKATLTLQGFNTRIQKVQTPEGHTWFRVTLGPFATESNALQQKKRLEEQKIHGILILQRSSV